MAPEGPGTTPTGGRNAPPKSPPTSDEIDAQIDAVFAPYVRAASVRPDSRDPLHPRMPKEDLPDADAVPDAHDEPAATPGYDRTSKEIAENLDTSILPSRAEEDMEMHAELDDAEMRDLILRLTKLVEPFVDFAPTTRTLKDGRRVLTVQDPPDIDRILEYLDVSKRVGAPVYVDMIQVAHILDALGKRIREQMTVEEASLLTQEREHLLAGNALTAEEQGMRAMLVDLLGTGEETLTRFAPYELENAPASS